MNDDKMEKKKKQENPLNIMNDVMRLMFWGEPHKCDFTVSDICKCGARVDD